VNNFKEFLAWAKPQKDVSYATPGAGSPHHLATALFGEQGRVTLSHVPYRGAAPRGAGRGGGQVPFMFVDTASGYPFIATGKLRAIGVASAQRVRGFEQVPHAAGAGLEGLRGLCLARPWSPAGTPPASCNRLNAVMVEAMAPRP
jgi:tripartite-type tricarboxylate transporter receptor subunit TctC